MTLVPSGGLVFWLVARQRPVFGQGRLASWQAAEQSAGRLAGGRRPRAQARLGTSRAVGAQGRLARRPWAPKGPALGWLEVQAYTHRLRYQGQSVFVAHASDNDFGQRLNVGGASIATVGNCQDVHG